MPWKRDLSVLPIVLAFTAAAFRLIPLQWLHPLNWDELEFFKATKWIAEGQVPFRDFWEHHSPLTWFLFAPVARFVDSPGVSAIIALRWAQVPVWIATFWLLQVWMRNAGVGRFARWSAVALALSSSMFMIPAVEYRVDSVACALYMAGLVLVQRGGMTASFLAGVAFCLTGIANLRFGPVLVVTVLLLAIVRPRERRWGWNRNVIAVWSGGLAALVATLSYFALTGSLGHAYQQLWVENQFEKFATAMPAAFIHRILIPFGIRVLDASRFFDPAGVDAGGVAILLLGGAALVRMVLAWRTADDLFVLTVLQTANLTFIASMKFIYNYHLLLVVVLMTPLVAAAIERVRRRQVIIVLLLLSASINLFASVFRGKELDRAYQDRIMREVHARTTPGARVWGGMPWALQREPAYRFWFLPELARVMVRQRLAEPFAVQRILQDPPAAVIFDHNILAWVVLVQRELVPYFTRHYVPVWRNLWMPGMNSVLNRGDEDEWIVPRDGDYRLYVSAGLAAHPWFHLPLRVVAYKGVAAGELTFELPPPSGDPDVRWLVDGESRDVGARITLRRGQRLRAINSGGLKAVFLIPSDDRVLFRQPPPTVSLEAEAARVTHVPRIGARLDP